MEAGEGKQSMNTNGLAKLSSRLPLSGHLETGLE